MKIIFYIEILSRRIYWSIPEGNAECFGGCGGSRGCCREIKIADFGTSKRLAGLQLCTEDSVGTLQYMSPDVVLVPPMGYGPEVSDEKQ